MSQPNIGQSKSIEAGRFAQPFGMEVLDVADGGSRQAVKENPVDGTTWEFLKSGWWVLHIIAIGLVFWLGHVLWPMR